MVRGPRGAVPQEPGGLAGGGSRHRARVLLAASGSRAFRTTVLPDPKIAAGTRVELWPAALGGVTAGLIADRRSAPAAPRAGPL